MSSMIKTLQTVDILNVLSTYTAITNLVTLYASEPTPKWWCYGWLSIVSNAPTVNSNKWMQVKEVRLSIVIVAEKAEDISSSEEKAIDTVLDTITSTIVDEGCSKISQRGDLVALYCIEGNCTPLLITMSDRAYKVKDFLLWYQSHYD